jgi:hypothetical protein
MDLHRNLAKYRKLVKGCIEPDFITYTKGFEAYDEGLSHMKNVKNALKTSFLKEEVVDLFIKYYENMLRLDRFYHIREYRGVVEKKPDELKELSRGFLELLKEEYPEILDNVKAKLITIDDFGKDLTDLA